MKMKDALEMINAKSTSGFMVSFEWIEGSILRGDHFPDKHAREKLIETENEAWDLARKFADATKGKTCNIYVIKNDFVPVNGYKIHEIINR